MFLSLFLKANLVIILGNKIEAMLKWKGDYTQLEWNHQYIQW